MGVTVPIAPGLKRKYLELVVFYSRHSETIGRFWRSLDHEQRRAAIHTQFPDDLMMAHDQDGSKRYRAELCRVLAPDWNAEVIAGPDPEYLLDFLALRTTGSLLHQACPPDGPNASDGDCGDVLCNLMDELALHSRTFTMTKVEHLDSVMRLRDTESYGEPVPVPSKSMWDIFSYNVVPGVDVEVPWGLGRYVLLRQEFLVTRMTHLTHHLINLEASIRNQRFGACWVKEGQREIPARPYLTTQPAKLNMAKTIATCNHLKASSREQLEQLTTDPFAFRRAVSAKHIGMGRSSRSDPPSQPSTLDEPSKASSIVYSAFKTLFTAVENRLTWEYMSALLALYVTRTGHHAEAVAKEMQSLSQVQLEDAISELQRQIGNGLGKRWVRGAKFEPKTRHPKPFEFMDRHLYILLAICLSGDKEDATVSLAQAFYALGIHYKEYPSDIYKLTRRENVALCRLAKVLRFCQLVSYAVPGTFSPTEDKCMLFNKSGTQKDAAPSGDIFRAFMDVVDKVCKLNICDGTYEPFGAKSVKLMATHLEEVTIGPVFKESLAHFENHSCPSQASAQPVCFATSRIATETGKSHSAAKSPQSQTPKVKVKTRPTKPADADTEIKNQAAKNVNIKKTPAPSRLTVKAQTSATFSTIFAKATARGKVNWSAFISAMSDLGFSVNHKEGSLCTFVPPASLSQLMPFGIHRPHDGILEGFRLMKLARRLTRRYGWTLDSFQTA